MLRQSSLVNWPRSQSQDRRFKVHFFLALSPDLNLAILSSCAGCDDKRAIKASGKIQKKQLPELQCMKGKCPPKTEAPSKKEQKKREGREEGGERREKAGRGGDREGDI